MYKTFSFHNKEYDDNGINKTTGQLFLDIIVGWEQDFQNNFSPFKATHLFSNYRTMSMIDRCFDNIGSYKSGMDLYDGEINIDEELKVDTHSDNNTIYAIGSELEGNEDEALFLVTDNDMVDGVVVLKFITDDNDNIEEEAPIHIIKKVKA